MSALQNNIPAPTAGAQESWVLEWSGRQNNFHVQRLKHALQSNLAMFAKDGRNDYLTLAIGTHDEVSAMADELRPVQFKRDEAQRSREAEVAEERQFASHFLEWSSSTNTLHIEEISDPIKNARKAFIENRPSDGRTIAIGSLEKCREIAHDLKPVLVARESALRGPKPEPLALDDMLSSLALVYPTLPAMSLSDWDPKNYGNKIGVLTGASAGGEMHDGMPIFHLTADGEGPYDGVVHNDFIAWLHERGWYCERYDGETFFLLPDDGTEDKAVEAVWAASVLDKATRWTEADGLPF